MSITVTKHFQRYTSIQRADLASSHRLGHRQRQAIGQHFWVVDGCNIAFKTRKAAIAQANAMLAARERTEGGAS